MNVNEQNPIRGADCLISRRRRAEECRVERGRRTEEMHGIIATHLFMVIVFPLLQGLVDLSFSPQAVDVMEKQRGWAAGGGAVRRGLKRMHHQWSLQMAAHARASRPRPLGRLQHTLIFFFFLSSKKTSRPKKLSNQTTPNWAPRTGRITACSSHST